MVKEYNMHELILSMQPKQLLLNKNSEELENILLILTKLYNKIDKLT